MKNRKLLIVAAVLVAILVGLARPIGIYLVSSDDPNAVTMQYGGTVRIEIVSHRIDRDPDDPNVMVVTIRQKISEWPHASTN